MTEDGAVEQAVARGLDAFGRLEVAGAKAGFGAVGRLVRLTLADYRGQPAPRVSPLVGAVP